MAAIKAVIASQFDATGLKKAQSEFAALGSTIKGALGAVGLTLSVGAIASALNEAGKAAVADNKAQQELARQVMATTGATREQAAAVEQAVQKMQLQSAVADDQIRPAMAQLVRATGDVTSAQRLMQLALDVSAGTGKDLQSVSIALGKAYQGNTGALQKLGIAVKGVNDPFAMLEKSFAGASAEAAKNDPYAQMGIVIQNLQEQIGTYLLPNLQDLASYFASDAGQKDLNNFAESIGNVVTSFNNLINIAKPVGAVLGPIFDVVGAITAEMSGNSKQASELTNKLFEMVAGSTFRNKPGQPGVGDAARYSGLAEFYKNKAAFEAAQKKADAWNPYKSAKKTGGKTAVDQTAQNIADAMQKAKDAVRSATDDISKLTADQAKAFDDLKVSGQESLDAVAKSVVNLDADLKNAIGGDAGLGQFESAIIATMKSVKDSIASALDSKQITSAAASALTAYVDLEQKAFAKIAKQRDDLAKKISIARSISAGILGAGNITAMLQTETKQVTQTITEIINGVTVVTQKTVDMVTGNDLIGAFNALLAKTKTFAANLIQLKKLGLNGTLFKQIVDAGVDAGGATAEAIVAGGADSVAALNSSFAELNSVAGDIAKTSTDTFFALGENVTNGFIDGLLSQESALQTAAQSLADAFKTAFGNAMAQAVGQKNMMNQVDLVRGQIGDIDSQLASARQSLKDLGAVSAAKNPAGYAQAKGLMATIRGLVSQRGLLSGQLDTLNSSLSAPMPTTTDAVTGTTINLTVNAGIGTNGQSVGQQIVNEIKKYERVGGAIWVAA